MKSSFLSGLIVSVALTTAASGQVLTPVAFTYSSGTTGDVIVGPAAGDTTANITVDSSAYQLVEQGQDASDTSFGIPDGVFTSAGNSNASFEFGPSNGNNILKGDGTLTLSTPASFSDISFLVQSLTSGATNDATFVLNFSDGTTDTLTTAGPVPYWVGGDPTTSGGVVAFGGGAIYQTFDGNYNGSYLTFEEYDFSVASGDVGKTLDSITVDANGEQLRTYAVSGTEAVPEPATWAMLFLATGLLAFLGRMRATPNA